MTIRYLYLSLISLSVLFLDQAIKLYVHTKFYLGESIPVINGFFNLTYVRNKGAAFGFLKDAQYDLRRFLLLTIPPVVLIIIVFITKDIKENKNLNGFFLALICGGTVGNYTDRIRYDYVVDFLDFYYGRHHFPAFNLADSAIVVGLLGIFIFNKEKPESKVSS